MPGFWLINFWKHQGPTFAIAWIVWVIASITIHELAHGFVAIRRGDRTPITMGRITLNPLVHMGPLSLIIFALTGVAWGVMPVSPSRLRGKHALAAVAAAGPAANLALALLCLITLSLWTAAAGGYWFKSLTVSEPTLASIQTILWVGLALNLFLCLFNLIPVPPLDGATILRELSPAYQQTGGTYQSRRASFGLFALVFVFASQYIYAVAFDAADSLANTGLRLIAPSAPPHTDFHRTPHTRGDLS